MNTIQPSSRLHVADALRGIDFRRRFFWRLVLLLGMGYLNGLIYSGDIPLKRRDNL